MNISPEKQDHPLFNSQRVPRVLEKIEDTQEMDDLMWGLSLDPISLKKIHHYESHLFDNWLTKNKIRCPRCLVLKKDFGRVRKRTFQELKWLERVSKPTAKGPQVVIVAEDEDGKGPDPAPGAENDTQTITNEHGTFMRKVITTPNGNLSLWYLPCTEEEKAHVVQMGTKCQPNEAPLCLYHPGNIHGDICTCCEKDSNSKGCVLKLDHAQWMGYIVHNVYVTQSHEWWQEWKIRTGHQDFLSNEWLLHATPDVWCIPSVMKGVVLSCKTGINHWGEKELIRISAVDLFNGRIVLDHLVWPKHPMRNLDTKNSCISWAMLNKAHEDRRTLDGRDSARALLWDSLHKDAFLVCHHGQSDLVALRLSHDRIIDTSELETRLPNPDQNRTLKHLAKKHLNRDIQVSQWRYDSLEDAMAIRNLVFWYAKNLPTERMIGPARPVMQEPLDDGDWSSENVVIPQTTPDWDTSDWD
ncbi:hypothetical protein N7520_004133 [Penicillium odoratum]|uniref:uncharacterized protein n=1 Tax=Penicillium odoratum TaxID=1167516 RepID=UPI0025474968|nr:uncharacterized protein N7520_004133 [Penicillium odoratum]KAJ5769574.1 hypothetical protein N7520_004133 [Penicillium odoratum]